MSQAQHDGGISRRRFLRGVGGTAAAGALVAAGSSPAAAWDLSWEDAATAATEAAVPGINPGTSYLARQVQDITGGETVPPGSSTPEAIAESWYRTGMYAGEHDEWALQVLWNRLEDARTIANVKAKGVGIQAIDNGESESFVLSAAKDEIDQYYAMIQTNLANHWKVQVNKHATYAAEVQDHSDISSPELFAIANITYDWDDLENNDTGTESVNGIANYPEHTLTLTDGTTMDVPYVYMDFEHEGDTVTVTATTELRINGTSFTENLSDYNYDVNHRHSRIGFRMESSELPDVDADREATTLRWESGSYPESLSEAEADGAAPYSDWKNFNRFLVLWDKIIDQHSQMIDNVETWVSNAYGSVQAGEIDVQDLVNNNPTVMASKWSTRYEQTGHLAYAAADLAALGLSFDSERRMRFKLDDGTELEGTLYVSDDEFEIAVGDVVQPSASSANFYAAADTATMERELADDEVRESVDGGEIKLNVGVIRQTEYVVTTTHDETVTIQWDDWAIAAPSDAQTIEDATEVNYDASGDLETDVTSVESVLHRYSGAESATVLELTDPFKITEAYDVETGEQADVIAGQGYNGGTTDVDLSWVDDYLEMREDTDDYANSGGGGGGGGVSLPDGLDPSNWLPDFLPDSIMGVPTWLVLATGGTILLLAR